MAWLTKEVTAELLRGLLPFFSLEHLSFPPVISGIRSLKDKLGHNLINESMGTQSRLTVGCVRRKST